MIDSVTPDLSPLSLSPFLGVLNAQSCTQRRSGLANGMGVFGNRFGVGLALSLRTTSRSRNKRIECSSSSIERVRQQVAIGLVDLLNARSHEAGELAFHAWHPRPLPGEAVNCSIDERRMSSG